MAALIFDFNAPLPRRLYWDASFLVHAVYPAGRYHRECYDFVDNIVTTDDDFLPVEGLRIYTCNPRILSQ